MAQVKATEVPSGQQIEVETSLDALGIILVLARSRMIVAICAGLGVLVGTALVLVLKPTYTAKATILPPQQQSSSAALLNQLGSMSSLGIGASSLGLKTPADLYVGMLESRTVADDLISKFQLQLVYGTKTWQQTRTVLQQHTTIIVGKDGLIELSVTDHDPKRSSDLANGYVEQLDKLNGRLAISEAAQRRVFFEQQLENERKALETAEEDLRSTQQETGLIQLSGQAQLILQSIADLRAEIANREVKLQSYRSFATDQNPDVIRLQTEIAQMRAQLAKMESEDARRESPGDVSVPSGSLPKDSLDYTRKLREVKYHESLFELLSKQEAAARIDEARSAPVLQTVDHAIVPDLKSGPPRMLIMLGFILIGTAAGAGLALARHALFRVRQNPLHQAKLMELYSYLRRP